MAKFIYLELGFLLVPCFILCSFKFFTLFVLFLFYFRLFSIIIKILLESLPYNRNVDEPLKL